MMGVIRKKTATRGGEGGVKYVCDVCSSDITSTVSTRSIPGGCLSGAGGIVPALSTVQFLSDMLVLGSYPMRRPDVYRIRSLRLLFRQGRVPKRP